MDSFRLRLKGNWKKSAGDHFVHPRIQYSTIFMRYLKRYIRSNEKNNDNNTLIH